MRLAGVVAMEDSAEDVDVWRRLSAARVAASWMETAEGFLDLN